MDDQRSLEPTPVLRVWERFWFEPIPPHLYAVIRILLGVLGCATLLGLSDASVFWDPTGLVPPGGGTLGIKGVLIDHGFGAIGGRALYFISFASCLSAAVGWQSTLAVALAFATSVLQRGWNYLPLSSADDVMRAFLFCLIWSDCGAVWSIDAWLAGRRHESRTRTVRSVIAPLRLIRFQTALVYLSAGLWKLYNPLWRDGSAVYYILNTNLYHRFPSLDPALAVPLTAAATYGTLAWEIAFPVLILQRHTRVMALVLGVFLHIGMLVTLEIGLFHFVMLAGYIAFLDPHKSDRYVARLSNFARRFRRPSSPVAPHS